MEELYCLATINVRAEFLPPTNMIAVRRTAAANAIIAAVIAVVQDLRVLKVPREYRDPQVRRVHRVRLPPSQWEPQPQERREPKLQLQIQVRLKTPF